jgi:uncharacterized protein (TIGR03067 family)
MQRRLLRVLGSLVALLSFVLAAAPARADDDKDKMQGTWKVIKAVAGKERAGKEDKDKMEVVVDGKNFTLTVGDAKETAHFVLDTEKKPHHIDFLEGGKTKTWHGIYEWDGKDLKLCWGPAGEKRPTDFGVRDKIDDRYYILRKK